MDKIKTALDMLTQWIESEDYKGYDPYDMLNSPFLKRLKGKKLRFYAQQIGRYSPINFRRLFGVDEDYNPKGLALISQAYLNLFQITGENAYLDKGRSLIEKLKELRYQGVEEYCWGYNFPWASRSFSLPAYEPSIVVSSFVGDMLLNYYEITNEREFLDISVSIGDFILKHLNRYETDKYLCFSYNMHDHTRTFNASILGAMLLSRIYSITKNEELAEPVKKATRYVIDNQKADGSWAYGFNEDGQETILYDFHQAYILEALIEISKNMEMNMSESIDKGIEFYMKKLFLPDGRGVYRYPKRYPVDIHNQAQGIISFGTLYGKTGQEEYLNFSRKIAEWTIEHMQSSKGYFYFQNGRITANKIPYMRWSQAWMMVALSNFLKVSREMEAIR